MKFWLVILARLMARTIGRGSISGAWWGTFFGLVMGIGLAWWVVRMDWAESMAGPGVSLSIVLMITGALVGSKVGPVRRVDDAAKVVRLTRYNKGLVPLCFVVLGMGALVYSEAGPPSREPEGPEARRYFQWGCVGVSVIALLVQMREVLWIEVGPYVLIKRGLGSRMYRIDEIAHIALRGPTEGIDLLESEDGALSIQFADGRVVSVGVPKEKMAALWSALEAGGVQMPKGEHP